jgi:hypothetical protein
MPTFVFIKNNEVIHQVSQLLSVINYKQKLHIYSMFRTGRSVSMYRELAMLLFSPDLSAFYIVVPQKEFDNTRITLCIVLKIVL